MALPKRVYYQILVGIIQANDRGIRGITEVPSPGQVLSAGWAARAAFMNLYNLYRFMNSGDPDVPEP